MKSRESLSQKQGAELAAKKESHETRAGDPCPSEHLIDQCAQPPSRPSVRWNASAGKNEFLNFPTRTLRDKHQLGTFAPVTPKKHLPDAPSLQFGGDSLPAIKPGSQMQIDIPEYWIPYLEPIIKIYGCSLLDYLIRLDRTPETVREDDLDLYIRSYTDQGGSLGNARSVVSRMRRILHLAARRTDPQGVRATPKRYGIPVRAFPEPLHSQVNEVRNFQAGTAVRKLGKPPVRAITSKGLENAFSSLYGYVVNIAGLQGIVSLDQLVTEELCSSFAEWGLKERHLLGSSIRHILEMISAALNGNPRYTSSFGSWLAKLIRNIPIDSQEIKRRRKGQKILSYETLAAIPVLLHRTRPNEPETRPLKVALAVRNELLMQWIVVLPWRQRNLRELRISGECPNLFRAAIPKISAMTKPGWVPDTPDTTVWQAQFSKVETKSNSAVRFVLPRCLVPILEEYLTLYRPLLVRGRDPGTLFLNEWGGPLARGSFTYLIASLTVRSCGSPVTPKSYRDIFAHMYLEKFPNDYLTLSKLLWHNSIFTTLQLYGHCFDQSEAMCRVERVLGV